MKRFCSILNQTLQIFPRIEFEQLVKETKAERHARGFKSWDQFVAMEFCHLGNAQSLREIEGGLASSEGRIQQLGMKKAPPKSTLWYANENRPWELFQKVFDRTYARCRQELGAKSKFRIKNRLLSIDSTHVALCSELFSWASYSRQKGAVKLHFTLDHGGYLPAAMVITTGTYSELTMARQQKYEAGTILLMDRGFHDFKWFHRLHDSGVLFVTRLKKDTRYEIVESMEVTAAGIVSDQRIRLTSRRSRKIYPDVLRLVTLKTETGEMLQFLTNVMKFAASTIAKLYKDRWQIEIFFKMLKQNLRIQSFLGTSANAVWTQIWTALIAMLIVKYLQFKARYNWSFSNLVYFLRMNLFVYRDLWKWLDDPFPELPPPKPFPQLDLAWT